MKPVVGNVTPLNLPEMPLLKKVQSLPLPESLLMINCGFLFPQSANQSTRPSPKSGVTLIAHGLNPKVKDIAPESYPICKESANATIKKKPSKLVTL